MTVRGAVSPQSPRSVARARRARSRAGGKAESARCFRTERAIAGPRATSERPEDPELEIRMPLRRPDCTAPFREYEHRRIRLLDVFVAYSLCFLRGSIVVACAFSEPRSLRQPDPSVAGPGGRPRAERSCLRGAGQAERGHARLLAGSGRGSLPVTRSGMRIGRRRSAGRTRTSARTTPCSGPSSARARGVGSADVPLWQQALGALVLTHEAFHLRHWRFRRNEGKVECQALANFRDATQRLGATAAQAEELYPYALALHDYKVRLFPQYRDPKCVILPWDPPTTTG